MRRRRWAFMAAPVAVGMVLSAGMAVSPATALAAGSGSQRPDVGTQRPGAGQQRHCVADLSPVPQGSRAVSTVRDFQCFDSFTDAISYATDGSVQLAPGAHELSRTQLARADGQAAASAVLGIEYKGKGYGGASLSLTGSGGCNSGASYRFPRMSSYGFNNTIASAKVYNNCFSTHYNGTRYRGAQHTCYSNCSSLGSMNNKTSSIEYW